MEEPLKTIDPKEFQELGYLQEVNRLFFHPLGLALTMITDEKQNIIGFGKVLDCREDEEGNIFDLINSNEDRINRFKERATIISNEYELRAKIRTEKLGYIIEPIPQIIGNSEIPYVVHDPDELNKNDRTYKNTIIDLPKT